MTGFASLVIRLPLLIVQSSSLAAITGSYRISSSRPSLVWSSVVVMARLSKSFALLQIAFSSHFLSLSHVLASPGHSSHLSLRVRAQPNDPECYVEPYNAPQITQQNFPPFDSDSAYIYRYRQQQSVNLGSW